MLRVLKGRCEGLLAPAAIALAYPVRLLFPAVDADGPVALVARFWADGQLLAVGANVALEEVMRVASLIFHVADVEARQLALHVLHARVDFVPV